MSIAYSDTELSKAFHAGRKSRQIGVTEGNNPYYKPKFLGNFIMTPYDMWSIGWRAADRVYRDNLNRDVVRPR